jgi:large-conductance mechanosensitive channel
MFLIRQWELIVAFSVFMLVKGMNTAKKKDVQASAIFEVNIKAVKCPHCTSDLK